MKAVIFDFNGTLIDDGDLHVKAWNRIITELGKTPLTHADMDRKFSGMTNASILRTIRPDLNEDRIQELSLRKEALYREEVLKMPGGPHLIAGAQDLFDLLKEHGIPFTIASASIRENMDFFTKTFHLDHWMDPSLFIYDNGKYPDKKGMYRDAVKLLHGENDTIIFEDALSGIRAAASIPGVRLYLIDNPLLKESCRQYACVAGWIRNYYDVIPVIEKELSSSGI